MDLLKKAIRLSLIVSIIPGCAATKIENSTVKIDNHQPLVFEFQSNTEPSKPVTKAEIVTAIAREIKRHSNYKPKYNESQAGNDVSTLIKGVSIRLDENFVDLTYNNGIQYEQLDSPRITRQIAPYDIQYDINNEIIKATVTPPSSYTVKTSRNLLMFPIDPYLSAEDINKDVTQINAKISPELVRTKKTKGEFTVSYNEDAVYANYSRLLKTYKDTYKTSHTFNHDLDKGYVYRINKGDRDIPVRIATFPYRNGTKVLYEFGITYAIKSDGSTTYYDSEAKNIIDQIKKIAND